MFSIFTPKVGSVDSVEVINKETVPYDMSSNRDYFVTREFIIGKE